MKMWCAPLVAGLAYGAVLWSAQPADDKPTWHADWATAQRIARQRNKPIFAVLVCRH